jgi:hypothetical protein
VLRGVSYTSLWRGTSLSTGQFYLTFTFTTGASKCIAVLLYHCFLQKEYQSLNPGFGHVRREEGLRRCSGVISNSALYVIVFSDIISRKSCNENNNYNKYRPGRETDHSPTSSAEVKE